MPATNVIDNALASLWYHPETKIVHHQVHKFLAGKDLQNILLGGLELLKKNGAQKWLSDDRAMPVLKQEDMDWAQAEWFPQMIGAGWKYWAIVQPEQAIGKMNIERTVKIYAEAGITAQYFSDPDEAMKWLENQ